MTVKKNKINVAEAFRLRVNHKLPLQEIANRFGCHKASISKALKRFIATLPNPEEIKVYVDNKSQLLTGVELKLISEIANPDKLKAASLNNAAYAFQQIHNANRLESGKSTMNAALTISLEHQEIARRVINEIVKGEVSKLRAEP
jgi:hypothetical protein